MFLKYVTETTELGARIFGMVHGVVFIVYCLVTVIVAVDQRWSVARTALGLDAAVPPFATLAFETYADRCGLIGADWLSREDSATAPQRAVCWLLVHLRLAVGLASSSPNRSEVRPEQSPPPPETDPLAVSPSMRHVRMSRLSHAPMA